MGFECIMSTSDFGNVMKREKEMLSTAIED
jgi:hypothetical protein